MKYWNIVIRSLDQIFIDKLSNVYDIDYYNADIYINDDTNDASFTNQIISYILTEAVNKLEVSDKVKDYIINTIYTNSLDSWYDLTSNDVDDIIDLTDEEKQIVKEFLDL